MARKKKVIEETTINQELEPLEIKEDFMNPPEEKVEEPEILICVEEKVEEPKKVEEKPKRQVLRFTPVGPKIEYI